MSTQSRLLTLFMLLSLVLLQGCSSDSDSSPEPSLLKVIVVDGSTSQGITGANIQVLNTETGNPVSTLSSDSFGWALASFTISSVQLKVSAQGYSPSPAEGVSPLPVPLTPGETTPVTVTLQPLDATLELGSISGSIFDTQDDPLVGALVIAEDGSGNTVSVSTDHNGDYQLYNVPADSITLSAWLAGYNFPASDSISLADGDALTGQDVTATSLATGSISGHVSFTATTGDIVDITLLHPGSRQVLPGMRTYTDTSANYTMSSVPNGTFEIIASLENDGYVIDPDTAVTQGVPEVTINNDDITKDFKVTGSITLTVPEGTATYAEPPELSNLPTFSWVKDSSYASADDYVVEVVDESSATIWGGFDAANNYAPRVTVPQGNTPSIAYDSDGTATVSPLEAGKVYQLRVYARSLDNTTTGYTLLSSTETLDGLFQVVEP